MFMLWFKKENEEITLLERVKKLEAKVARQDNEILDLVTATDIIRNKVLRKIQFKKIEKEDSKEPYNGMLLPE